MQYAMPMHALTMNVNRLDHPTDIHACNARVREIVTQTSYLRHKMLLDVGTIM
jgi:hypothetical protein